MAAAVEAAVGAMAAKEAKTTQANQPTGWLGDFANFFGVMDTTAPNAVAAVAAATAAQRNAFPNSKGERRRGSLGQMNFGPASREGGGGGATSTGRRRSSGGASTNPCVAALRNRGGATHVPTKEDELEEIEIEEAPEVVNGAATDGGGGEEQPTATDAAPRVKSGERRLSLGLSSFAPDLGKIWSSLSMPAVAGQAPQPMTARGDPPERGRTKAIKKLAKEMRQTELKLEQFTEKQRQQQDAYVELARAEVAKEPAEPPTDGGKPTVPRLALGRSPRQGQQQQPTTAAAAAPSARGPSTTASVFASLHRDFLHRGTPRVGGSEQQCITGRRSNGASSSGAAGSDTVSQPAISSHNHRQAMKAATHCMMAGICSRTSFLDDVGGQSGSDSCSTAQNLLRRAEDLNNARLLGDEAKQGEFLTAYCMEYTAALQSMEQAFPDMDQVSLGVYVGMKLFLAKSDALLGTSHAVQQQHEQEIQAMMSPREDAAGADGQKQRESAAYRAAQKAAMAVSYSAGAVLAQVADESFSNEMESPYPSKQEVTPGCQGNPLEADSCWFVVPPDGSAWEWPLTRKEKHVRLVVIQQHEISWRKAELADIYDEIDQDALSDIEDGGEADDGEEDGEEESEDQSPAAVRDLQVALSSEAVEEKTKMGTEEEEEAAAKTKVQDNEKKLRAIVVEETLKKAEDSASQEPGDALVESSVEAVEAKKEAAAEEKTTHEVVKLEGECPPGSDMPNLSYELETKA